MASEEWTRDQRKAVSVHLNLTWAYLRECLEKVEGLARLGYFEALHVIGDQIEQVDPDGSLWDESLRENSP